MNLIIILYVNIVGLNILNMRNHRRLVIVEN